MAIAGTLILAVTAMALAGCDWPFRSDYRDRLSSVVTVTAPDSVAVGASFEVTFPTFGTNGCWRQGNDRVSGHGLRINVTPFDREYVGSDACTDNEPVFHHSVRLIASTQGAMGIRVLRRLQATSGRDSVGIIDRTVLVR